VRNRLYQALTLPLLVLLAGCAVRSDRFPAGPGTPFPDFANVHLALAQRCAGVSTLTAELALSGRVGGDRIRGRVIAGFATPDAMRLEGVAPFGGPAFIMVSRGGLSTLLLPRENAAIQGAPPGDVLGTLAGVALSPADLLAVLTGCVVPSPVAEAGSQYGRDRVRLGLVGGAQLLLRRAGSAWRIVAAARPGWDLDYSEWPGTFPGAVRLRSTHAGGTGRAIDLMVRPAQISANVALGPEVFSINVPVSARLLTLDDLRDAGPLLGPE
jgi:hypothetical protein